MSVNLRNSIDARLLVFVERESQALESEIMGGKIRASRERFSQTVSLTRPLLSPAKNRALVMQSSVSCSRAAPPC